VSDSIQKRTKELTDKLVEDVKTQMPTIGKVKEIARLAKEIGEDTADIDSIVDVIEGFGKTILQRFDKAKLKE